MSRPTTSELARRIDVYLRRFEADDEINPKLSCRPYYYAKAYVAGSRLMIVYVANQGRFGLKRAEAITYLAWLDAGNVGKHWEMDE